MCNEEYDEYDEYGDGEEEEPETLILTRCDDGKFTMKKQSDFVKMAKEDAELFKGFIEENKELFKSYCKKAKVSGTQKTGRKT